MRVGAVSMCACCYQRTDCMEAPGSADLLQAVSSSLIAAPL